MNAFCTNSETESELRSPPSTSKCAESVPCLPRPPLRSEPRPALAQRTPVAGKQTCGGLNRDAVHQYGCSDFGQPIPWCPILCSPLARPSIALVRSRRYVARHQSPVARFQKKHTTNPKKHTKTHKNTLFFIPPGEGGVSHCVSPPSIRGSLMDCAWHDSAFPRVARHALGHLELRALSLPFPSRQSLCRPSSRSHLFTIIHDRSRKFTLCPWGEGGQHAFPYVASRHVACLLVFIRVHSWFPAPSTYVST